MSHPAYRGGRGSFVSFLGYHAAAVYPRRYAVLHENGEGKGKVGEGLQKGGLIEIDRALDFLLSNLTMHASCPLLFSYSAAH